MRALVSLPAVVALLAFPVFSFAAEEGTANTTTTTIITSQGDGQNGTSIIIDNSQAGNDTLLDGLEDRIDIQQRINDLIASAANDTAGRIADMRLSGNIASALFNLDSGQVEQTFFGDWSLEVRSVDNASFSADFGGGNGVNYAVGNLTLNSVQIINEHIALGGTASVTDSQGRSWDGVPVSIVVINGRGLAVTFGEPELDNLFGGQPLYGVVS